MGNRYHHIHNHITHQRILHLISSYQLAGDDQDRLADILESLLTQYPAPQIEVAIVATLAHNWNQIPLPRGEAFFAQVSAHLKNWDASHSPACVTPDEFAHITGLTAPLIDTPSAVRPS